MKTSSHTILDAKGYVRIVTEYQLTRAEKAALLKGPPYPWEGSRGEAIVLPLMRAGLLDSRYSFDFYLTPLGKQMVDLLNAKPNARTS